MTAKLLGIATRTAKRATMDTASKAEVSVAKGVGNDFRGKPGKRQVTVLTRESWTAACAEVGAELPWTVRRANLYVEGVALKDSTGQILRIGNVIMEITGETDPCYRMDEQHDGLTAALVPDWRGGVLCRVLTGGTIRVDDAVALSDPE